ncbi:Hypothetical Protein FCC1311_012502 [Hondaea fermentalgiana]|uniref:Uncharacterized protein n=1 Tax=Hondaea fermentalgiana TaxID=2315210 RepID=A0A2R5G980_9STRA|nr:Hypothetical Protein FCC1311_012502 [Hondaea fermentalgiana]|eukprot:GBG25033.1 Hypothetical Protein FCC1311_012502 [Hondaea fermentalgiana]
MPRETAQPDDTADAEPEAWAWVNKEYARIRTNNKKRQRLDRRGGRPAKRGKHATQDGPNYLGLEAFLDHEPGWTYRSWGSDPRKIKRSSSMEELTDEVQKNRATRLLINHPDHEIWTYVRKTIATPEGNIWRDKLSFCKILGLPLRGVSYSRKLAHLCTFSDPRMPYICPSRPQVLDERWRELPEDAPNDTTPYRMNLERQMRINPLYMKLYDPVTDGDDSDDDSD